MAQEKNATEPNQALESAFTPGVTAHLVGVRRIWAASPHNAFTTLARFRGYWYCAFRTALSHMSEDGRVTLIRSRDGAEWVEVACFPSPQPDLPDLRDPKLITEGDYRILLMAGATTRKEAPLRRSYLWESHDGELWGCAAPAGEEGAWLWSLAKGPDAFYSASYVKAQGLAAARTGRAEVLLYRADNGSFERLAKLYSDEQLPNETTLLFSGETGYAIIRRELAPGQLTMPPFNNGSALFATAPAPYVEWSTTDLGIYLGGPNMLQLPSGVFIVAARTITTGHYTGLWQLDPTARRVKELLLLPSGNDCGYPGLVWHEDRLWASYYSTHEHQCCIYFAEVRLDVE